jgi:sigma-B regulation protein RsbU (phosphoserine phosphatase)
MRVPFFQRLSVRLTLVAITISCLSLPILTEMRRRAVERVLRQQAELQSMAASSAVAEGLEGVLRSVEKLARYVARDLEERELTPAEVERIARNVMAVSPNVFGCTIAFEPYALSHATERFGLHLHRTRARSRLATVDMATPEYRYWARDWYREAIDRAQPVWSEPFFDHGGADANIVRIAVPFFRVKEGQRVPAGVVTTSIELDWLKRLSNAHDFFDTGYTIVFSQSGRLILHPNPKYVVAETIESLADKTNTPELITIRQSVIAKQQGAMSYHSGVFNKKVHVNYKPASVAGWGVIVGFEEEELFASFLKFRVITVVSLIATILVLGVIVAVVAGYTLRPLGQITAVTDAIARGDFSGELPSAKRNDEIGKLALSLAAIRKMLRQRGPDPGEPGDKPPAL